MASAQSQSKISPRHLERRAVVYLRQSSEQQVHQNRESQRLQYALTDRARDLGWTQVEVIDCDLGASAAIAAADRKGFQRLIASIAMGEVGIVLSREVSRLSRTDKDWCHLQEVCQAFGVLIGDADSVYDPAVMDDQLVLGIKGTLSVVELNVLRMRMQEGMQEKARRGELFRVLPPGYVLDGMGKVVRDPDQRVQEAIALVFRKFRESRSIRQTYLWFHGHGVELPVNKSRGGRMQLVWKLPSLSFVGYVLRNPFYAGAYFWGCRPVEIKLLEGKLKRVTGRPRSPEECKVFIPEHHEGYIDWATYEENQRRMRGNSLKLGADGPTAAVRSGQGLLARLLRCGRCGRKLHVRYWGRQGTAARYLCLGDYGSGGKYCLAFGGRTVDRRFSQELLAVIAPLGLQASLEAVERLARSQPDERAALERQLEEAEYEVQRAFEQYDEVDPRHRLVAAELERRWNAKLEEVERMKAALDALQTKARLLTEQERTEILEMGESFATLWESEHCSMELKKKIIRTVIEEVLVDMDETTKKLAFTIHWKGGTHTRFQMPKPVSGIGRKTSLEDLDVIRRMAIRYGDAEIARVLTKLGRRTATGKRWNAFRVQAARKRYTIRGQSQTRADPEVLTLAGAAAYCGVSDTTIRRLVEGGILRREQVVPWAQWEIRRSDLDSEPVRSVVTHLRKTGKLVLERNRSDSQARLIP
jgi:DNA invertase Pin-like site-specific DNA recombinase